MIAVSRLAPALRHLWLAGIDLPRRQNQLAAGEDAENAA
jgi:hypothetical protein